MRYDEKPSGTVTPEKILLLEPVPNGPLVKVTVAQLRGSAKTITFADSPYTVLDTDCSLFGDCDLGQVNVMLPLASSFPARILRFKKIDGGSTNRLSANSIGGDLIDGNTSFNDADATYDSYVLQSDGFSNWWIISKMILP